jgi:hypothetical protein
LDNSVFKGFTRDDVIREVDTLLDARATPAGALYEVKIKAPPERFLDWDKPLNQQPGGQKIIEEFSARREKALEGVPQVDGSMPFEEFNRKYGGKLEEAARFKIDPEWTGAQFYESSRLVPGDFRDPVAASAALKELGIPGIRYLDQGSRGAGEGSRNIVVFDDKLVEITKKNGQPVTAAERQQYLDDAMGGGGNAADKVLSAADGLKQAAGRDGSPAGKVLDAAEDLKNAGGGKPPAPPKTPEGTPPSGGEPPKPMSVEEARQKIHGKISVGATDPKTRPSLSTLYTKMVDDLHPLKGVSEDAYQLARLTLAEGDHGARPG